MGQVAGYHCWARFLAGGRWVPVDISEADKHPEKRHDYFGNLTADRVAAHPVQPPGMGRTDIYG